MKAQILLVTGVLAAGFGVAGAPDASALDYRKSEVAQLQGLDKITARISTFDVPVGQSVNFDHRSEDKTDVKVFDGWMFASTPGLSALEHPVYDVWVKECMEPSDKSPKAGDAMPSENNG